MLPALSAAAIVATWMTGPTPAAASAPSSEVAPAPNAPIEVSRHRSFQIENDRVRVWKTVVRAGQPLKMHRNRHDRVVVALKGGTVVQARSDGRRTPMTLVAGHSYYFLPDPPNDLRAEIIQSADEIEVVVIELKKEI